MNLGVPDPNHSILRVKLKFFAIFMFSFLCVYLTISNLFLLQREVVITDVSAESLRIRYDNMELNMMVVKSRHTNNKWLPNFFLPKFFQKTKPSVLEFPKVKPENNTLPEIGRSWNGQKLIQENVNMQNNESNAPFSKTWDPKEDGVEEHGVYSLGLTLTKGKFILNGDVVRIMSGSLDYLNLIPGEWKNTLFQMEKHGLNTVTLCVDRNLTKDGIQNLRNALTMVLEVYLFGILEIKLFTKCSENTSTVDLPVEANTWQISAYFEKLIPAIEEFQVTRGGSVIAFLFSDVDEDSTKSDYKNLFKYMVQRIRFYGIQELILKTESPQNLLTYPFSQIALPTVKFDYKVPISHLLYDIQTLNKDFPLLITANISDGSVQNLTNFLPLNISVNYILTTRIY